MVIRKRSLVLASIAILLIISGFIFNNSYAQAPSPAPQAAPAVQAAPPPQPVQPAQPKAQVTPAQAQPQAPQAEECPCLKPAIDVVQKAYSALEEDEWPDAIKVSKDAITTIKTLAKTCKCPEVAAYQQVTESFLKYAEGGNHLDGADEPNCPFALKLYIDAIASLKDAIPKIINTDVKSNATNIKEYAEEELQFVKDECQNQPATNAKDKSKGTESKKQ